MARFGFGVSTGDTTGLHVRPSAASRPGAPVGERLFLRRADDVGRDGGIHAARWPAWNAFFTRRSSPEWNVRIATRPPGARQCGSASQQRVERRELVVHGDAQRLERAADRHLHVGLRQARQCRGSGPARTRRLERMGRVDRLLLQQPGDDSGVRLVGVLVEQIRELLFAAARASSRDAGSPREGSSACRAGRRSL